MDERWQKGRGKRRFSYTYQDLARLLGMTEEAVRQAAHRGKFDPADLRSVVAFYVKRKG
jgi:hypothetical protein